MLVPLKIYNSLKNILKENISQEFRWKNIDETRNCFPEEIGTINWWVESTKKFV